MSFHRSRLGWFAALLVGVVTGACSENGPDRVEISGSVALKGKPLDEGTIEFEPVGSPSPGTPYTKGGAVIKGGEYLIPRDQGLAPGKYKVRISSGDGQTPVVSDQPPGPSGNFTSKDRIPREYNVATKLEREVKRKGLNRFDFKIP